jgi:hypothetical protein
VPMTGSPEIPWARNGFRIERLSAACFRFGTPLVQSES